MKLSIIKKKNLNFEHVKSTLNIQENERIMKIGFGYVARGKGVFVVGKVESDVLSVGDNVEIRTQDGKIFETTILEICVSDAEKNVKYERPAAKKGELIECLVRRIDLENIKEGDYICYKNN